MNRGVSQDEMDNPDPETRTDHPLVNDRYITTGAACDATSWFVNESNRTEWRFRLLLQVFIRVENRQGDVQLC